MPRPHLRRKAGPTGKRRRTKRDIAAKHVTAVGDGVDETDGTASVANSLLRVVDAVCNHLTVLLDGSGFLIAMLLGLHKPANAINTQSGRTSAREHIPSH